MLRGYVGVYNVIGLSSETHEHFLGIPTQTTQSFKLLANLKRRSDRALYEGGPSTAVRWNIFHTVNPCPSLLRIYHAINDIFVAG